MSRDLQIKENPKSIASAPPAGLIVICSLVFVAGIAATIYFCRTMGGGMTMPGGWRMSMMWMRMEGQTWFGSAADFLLMWLAMMVAMMMPSVLPTFLRTRQRWGSLFVASGYFTIWLAAGIALYFSGMMFAAATMQSDSLSRAVPWLLGVSLITAGTIQLTRWKMRQLSVCRSPFGCTVSCRQQETDFRLGCRQGVACCLCCVAPMTILLALGMMNPLVIIAVAIIIAAERILSRPTIVVRLVGILTIITGVCYLCVVVARPG